MPKIDPLDYTWSMLEQERDRGSNFAEQTLERVQESTEEILSNHGMSIPDVDVFNQPSLPSGVQGSTAYPETPGLDGMIFIGSESPQRPTSFEPRISDTMAEEYMHIQFEGVEDFDLPTEMGVDILGSVWTLYARGKLDDQEAIDEMAYYSKHGYNNRGTNPAGYGDMVEEGIYDLIEDFDEADSNRQMMEYALQNPGKLLEKYNSEKL